MRIALIASSRHPIREPFAGGLEAHTWALADGLRRRGHQVSLFAGPGSDASLTSQLLATDPLVISAAARTDTSMVAAEWLADHHAYLTLMMGLAAGASGPGDYDIVHNNSLHHLPIAMARLLPVPLVTTLHTPPTPWLESAISSGPCPVHFAAVSRFTARSWRHVVPEASVIHNGVDLDRWRVGTGGGPAVWFGRMVAEKGPDLAVRAARLAGVPLLLVGPIQDRTFFTERVQPLLGGAVRYLGHRTHDELRHLVARASATLVTPRWDEPYGLVAAESLACGTPVIGFCRGGLTEVVDAATGSLVGPDDVTALARELHSLDRFDRAAARSRAERECSVEQMITGYEAMYAGVCRGRRDRRGHAA